MAPKSFMSWYIGTDKALYYIPVYTIWRVGFIHVLVYRDKYIQPTAGICNKNKNSYIIHNYLCINDLAYLS